MFTAHFGNTVIKEITDISDFNLLTVREKDTAIEHLQDIGFTAHIRDNFITIDWSE